MSKGVRIKLNKKRGMVAIFMAITIKIMLSFVLLQYSENNVKQILSMKATEDKIKAKYLALSGINFSILLLQIQRTMIDPLSKKIGFNFLLWKQVPISSSLLSMFMDKENTFAKTMLGEEEYNALKNDEFFSKKEEEEKEPALDEDGKPIVFERNFNFDGEFNVEISDETSKFNLNLFRDRFKKAALKYQLLSLLNQPEYKTFFESERENDTVIPPEEVVAAIEDWVDYNEERSGLTGGSEDERYAFLKHKYLNKNNRFSSFSELYMVYGIDDDFMSMFKDSITIYGGEEININTCEQVILRALIYGLVKEIPPSYLEAYSLDMNNLINQIVEYRSLKPFANAEEFFSLLNTVEGIRVDPVKKRKFKIITSSNIFKITSYGLVGDSITKIEAVVDSKRPLEQYLYYREE